MIPQLLTCLLYFYFSITSKVRGLFMVPRLAIYLASHPMRATSRYHFVFRLSKPVSIFDYVSFVSVFVRLLMQPPDASRRIYVLSSHVFSSLFSVYSERTVVCRPRKRVFTRHRIHGEELSSTWPNQVSFSCPCHDPCYPYPLRVSSYLSHRLRTFLPHRLRVSPHHVLSYHHHQVRRHRHRSS